MSQNFNLLHIWFVLNLVRGFSNLDRLKNDSEDSVLYVSLKILGV